MIRSSIAAYGLLAALLGSAPVLAADTGQKPASHATRIIFLGTYGGPKAVKFRSEPATLLVADGTPYLVDVGPGTDRQIAWAGFKHSDVKAVFITHHHIDHDGGLVPFISLTWFEKAWHHLPPLPVGIYGPPATTYLVHSALDYLSVSERIFRAGVPALPPSEGMFDAHDIEKDGPFYTDGGVHVTAAQNAHFFFASHDPNGATDKSYAYRFETPAGAVVFTGDTGPSDAVVKLAEGADVLVSEVCLCGGDSSPRKSTADDARPPEGLDAQEIFHMVHEHMTPEEVGTMAARAHVRTVILTHFVPGDDDETDVSKYTAGVRKNFSGTVIAARDLFEFDLP
jgi:ribonuclease BN (tRNA processing enzyme)